MEAFRHFGRLIAMGHWRGQCSAALFSVLSILLVTGWAQAQNVYNCTECVLNSGGVQVSFSCSETAITLTGISPETPNYGTGGWNVGPFNFLNGSAPLFSYSDDGTDNYVSDLKNVTCGYGVPGQGIGITADSNDGLLAFFIGITSDGCANCVNTSSVVLFMQVTYQGPTGSPATKLFRAMLPNFSFNVPNSDKLPGSAWAMVPQGVGGVVPLTDLPNLPDGVLGAPYASTSSTVPPSAFGLPTSLNVMDIADVYDGSPESGGGLFVMDLNDSYITNSPPVQFNVTQTGGLYQITGYWTATLKLNQTNVMMPTLAIGIHSSGDWHYAVDYYVSQHASWSMPFPNTPSWLRNAGGVYSLGIAGGGSFLGMSGAFPAAAIGDHYVGIQQFACNVDPDTHKPKYPNSPGSRCLLDVFSDAQSLDSNVIYLTGWWSGGYNNKGDYIADQNLGGVTGLQEGVAQVQAAGGHVILYMEPYLVSPKSILGSSAFGPGWVAQPGPPITIPYGATAAEAEAEVCRYGSDCMAIPNTQWQDYLINRAVNVTQTTGVDGFFLDSWGWQMNWPVGTTSENVDYTSQQWSAAALRFIDRFRAAIQPVNNNAIVIGEHNVGELPFHWDGGSANDLLNGGILLASPVRYAMPQTNFFINGPNLGSVNQAIASGHNLALGPFWLLDVMESPYFSPAGTGDYIFYGPGTNLTTTAGSTQATVASGTGLKAGLFINASSVPYGTTISKITGTTLMMSQAPLPGTGTTTVSATFSDYPIPPKDSAVAAYIKKLMKFRRSAIGLDTLVNGTQLPMPVTNAPIDSATNAPDVVAFLYQGQTYQVLAVVNNGSTTVPSVKITLGSSLGTGQWGKTPVLGASSFTTDTSGNVTIESLSPAPSASDPAMGGLVILSRLCDKSCSTPIAGSGTAEVPLMNETFPATPSGGNWQMNNWTDWMVQGSGAVASGRWSIVLEESGVNEWNALQANSLNDSSLLFYDSFGGGDFTYTGIVTFDQFPAGSAFGGAGLSFRLSDNPQTPDAGNQGYDVILTNQPAPGASESGSVMLRKRPNTVLKQAPFNVSLGQTYNLSVTTSTTWTLPTAANYPTFPLATTITVSVNGTSFTYTDSDAPSFSGRFGVNTTYANAHFTCLQATDGPVLPACPPPGRIPPPVPRGGTLPNNAGGGGGIYTKPQ